MRSCRASTRGWKLRLGKYADAVSAAIKEAEKGDVMRRIWRKDAALWKSDEAHQKIIKNSLGWLNVADEMIGVEDELVAFADRIRAHDFKHVVLCGMGGSSLCARSPAPAPSAQQEGFPELLVLDSTDPDTVAEYQATGSTSAHTLFVVSSKSGTTTEPLMFYRYWYDQVARVKENPGENFLAVTDPGTQDGGGRHARQVQAHLPQPARHRRALLGALLLRHGAGGADGLGHQEAARPRRARHALLLAGRARVREPGRAARRHHRRVRQGRTRQADHRRRPARRARSASGSSSSSPRARARRARASCPSRASRWLRRRPTATTACSSPSQSARLDSEIESRSSRRSKPQGTRSSTAR